MPTSKENSLQSCMDANVSHLPLWSKFCSTIRPQAALSIQMKNLVSAPPRLQRMLLRLQSFDVTIRYRPGNQIHVADALSRLSSDESMAIPDLNVQVRAVCPQFSNECLRKMQEQTPKEPELAALKEVVFNSWSNSIKELPPVLRPYWNYREELSIEDSLIMKRHRIIIPQVLQGDILAKLHASHQGAEKTKLRAGTSVFWKDLNKDIEDMTKSCKVCQELKPNQPREPLLQTEVPPRPWHTIGTDLFFFPWR